MSRLNLPQVGEVCFPLTPPIDFLVLLGLREGNKCGKAIDAVMREKVKLS